MDDKVETKSEFDELNVEIEKSDKTDINNDNEPINKKAKLLKNNDDVDDDIVEDDETAISMDQNIPEEGFIYPLEQDASDMLNETDFDGYFPSVTERYLTPYYQLDVQKPGDDICIRIHSNRICMISLAPSHIIFEENKTIKSCNFKVSDKLDRLKNKVSGKSKHGAQPLQSNSNLCCLSCDDGSTYMIKCCMIGKLVEVNERLIENPELLRKEPHFGGYIAIVLPNLKHLEKTREKLLNEELYQEAIRKRKENKEKEKEEINGTEKLAEEMDVSVTQAMNHENVEANKTTENQEVIDKNNKNNDNNVNCVNISNILIESKNQSMDSSNIEMEVIES